MLDARYWMLDAGYWMLDTRYWMLDAGYSILEEGTRYKAAPLAASAQSNRKRNFEKANIE
jgi:hypothetical protein